MPYIIKERYFANDDETGETYVITSDGTEFNTNLKIGTVVELLPNVENELLVNLNNAIKLCKEGLSECAISSIEQVLELLE